MPKRTDLRSILIVGSGPIRIGQGCEFDYAGVQACRALRAEGYRVVLANSNPATIMTDPEWADADRPGAGDQDAAKVGALRHAVAIRSKKGTASCGPGAASGWNWSVT